MPTIDVEQPKQEMTIGELIRFHRVRKGLTQAALAQAIGSGNMTISGYETDLRIPAATKVPLLANALGIDLDDLTGRVCRAGR